MNTPNGTKRTAGFTIMVVTVVAGLLGYAPSDAAPIEMARFADEAIMIAGLAIALYGEYRAKAPMWFSKG